MMRYFAETPLRPTPILGGVQAVIVMQDKLSTMVVTLLISSIRTSGIALTPFVDASSYWTCSTCSFRSCFSCRTPAHLPLNCAQHKASLANQRSIQESLSINWLNANTVVCDCGRWCQKINGCDHITCPSRPIGCGAQWCWKCRASYDDINRVGNSAHRKNCPHYTVA